MKQEYYHYSNKIYSTFSSVLTLIGIDRFLLVTGGKVRIRSMKTSDILSS
ncbi:hypothetical protein [Chryseobacterium paludis]|nr:hypothetical protein [Chryseobacterium paludis]